MNRIPTLLTILTSFFSLHLEAKVRFLTFHYNKPDFLELQIKTFQKFIEDDYELIVFNDAPTEKMENEIRNTCKQYGVKCIRYEQEWHHNKNLEYNRKLISYVTNPKIKKTFPFGRSLYAAKQPSARHSHVIKFALETYGIQHDDLVVILDGDVFAIRPVSLKSLQNGYHVMGSIRELIPGIHFFWVPFISLNMPLLPNKSDIKFDLDVVDNYFGDTGTAFYYYLKNHPELLLKKYPYDINTYSRDLSLNELTSKGFTLNEAYLCKNLPATHYVEYHIDHHFLHFGSGSFNYKDHESKEQYVKDFINTVLNEGI